MQKNKFKGKGTLAAFRDVFWGGVEFTSSPFIYWGRSSWQLTFWYKTTISLPFPVFPWSPPPPLYAFNSLLSKPNKKEGVELPWQLSSSQRWPVPLLPLPPTSGTTSLDKGIPPAWELLQSISFHYQSIAKGQNEFYTSQEFVFFARSYSIGTPLVWIHMQWFSCVAPEGFLWDKWLQVLVWEGNKQHSVGSAELALVDCFELM